MSFETKLTTYLFEKYVLEVAIMTLERGISASKLTTYQFLEPVDAWGFPKYPAKTAILPPHVELWDELKRFIALNRVYLEEQDTYLGTWINPDTHYYYLDITISREDVEEARREAVARGLAEGRKVVALYNSLRDQTIYL